MNRLSKILAITLSAMLVWEAVFPSAVLAEESSGTDSAQPAAESAEESAAAETSSPEDPALAAAAINKADEQYFGTKLPRYQAPASSNPFYFSRNNIYEASGYGMPNCTAYAWGRAYEYYQKRPSLSKYNAGEWWTDNINWQAYEFGQEPKVGAIAVWDQWNQDSGHVAFVEAIEGDNVILSESSWHGTMFRVRTIKADSSNYLYGGSYRFCGYIYVGEPYEGRSHTPGERWRTYESVNARYSPSASADRWITIRSGAEIDVTETVEAEGYLWGKITYAGTTAWCILNYAVCLSNPSLTPDPPTRTLAEAENRVISSKNGVNLRYGPGTKYDVITWIPGDMVVAVTDIADGSQYTWGKTTFNGIEGWFVYDYTSAAPAGAIAGEPVPAEESSVPDRNIPDGDTSAAETSVPETIFEVEESSKAESSKEESSKAESSKAESSKVESSKAESSKEESSKAEEISELRVISTSAGVNLRSGAGTSYQIVGTIPYETVVLVTAKQSDSKYTWGKTNYKGKEGWFVYNYTTEAPAGYEEGMSVADSSKTESSKAESSKAESSKAESSKTESSKAESSKAESSKAESSKPESSKAESAVKPAAQTVDVSGYPSIYRYKTGVSDYVVILQKQLLALGYDVQVADGYFGAVTDQMVKQFQTDNRLYVDGIVGQKTWTALFAQDTSSAPQTEESRQNEPAAQQTVQVEDYASYPTIYRGKYGVSEYVSKLQTKLNALGYNVGPVDGYFGDQTYLQVIAYQRDQKLVIDGYVGPVTWASLFRSEGDGSGAGEETGTPDNPPASTPEAAKTETPAQPAKTADVSSYPYLKVFGSGNTDYVKLLQEQLNKLGYSVGPADGIFGYQTEAQVMAFQKSRNLYVDGEVGQKTWAALYADGSAPAAAPAASAETAPAGTAEPAASPAQQTAPVDTASYPYLTVGSSNAQYVKILQEQLNKLGYSVGPADGIFGAQTEAQVRAFQKAKGLYVDGQVGPVTWRTLFA